MPRYTLLLAGCLLLTSSATAQTAHSPRLNVSVQGGVIRNFQNEDEGQPRYAFHPEVQITSRPFPLVRGISLQGGLRWGYWDDGVREDKSGRTIFALCGPPEEPSCTIPVYSHSSHIAGVRFYVVPTQIPLVSLSLFSGLSWHFVSGDHIDISYICTESKLPILLCNPDVIFDRDLVDGYSYWGRNYHERFRTLEVGLRVAVPLGNRLAVTTEAQKYIHRSIVERISHTPNRFVYKLGLSFGFF